MAPSVRTAMRVTLSVLTTLWTVAGCASAPTAPAPTVATVPVRAGPPPAPATPGEASASASIAPEQTAGLYWVPYVTCDDCDRPEAIVAYVTPRPASAQRIVDALEGKLALGLPYVIHTDELGLAPRGIAIVTGSYASLDAARVAAANTPQLEGHAATALELEGDDDGYPANTPAQPRHVTVVDRGRPVPAWSKADLDAVMTEMSESDDPDAQQTLQSQRRWLQRALARRRPACTVRPGELFVVEDQDVEWYDFAPVQCGGKLAYIDWTSSLLGHAVVVPDGDRHRLYQVVGAECDQPIIDAWTYDRDGRHPTEAPAVVALGGC